MKATEVPRDPALAAVRMEPSFLPRSRGASLGLKVPNLFYNFFFKANIWSLDSYLVEFLKNNLEVFEDAPF